MKKETGVRLNVSSSPRGREGGGGETWNNSNTQESGQVTSAVTSKRPEDILASDVLLSFQRQQITSQLKVASTKKKKHPQNIFS